MGVLQFLVTVETIGGLEGALLHLVEDVLYVDEVTAFEVERLSDAEELLYEEGHVEFIGVIPCEVGISDEFGNRWG